MIDYSQEETRNGQDKSSLEDSTLVDTSQPSSRVGGTLIEQIGGPEAAMGILIPSVEIFYARLLSDERINEFFEGIDTERLKNKQVEFLAYVFGSPERYTGKDIAEAHEDMIKNRGLNEYHFDIVAEHFHQSLIEVKLPDNLIQQALEILLTSRPIFEHKSEKKDKFGDALEMIRAMKAQQERDILKLKSHLESLGLDKEKQWEVIRAGLRMRDPSAVEYLDSFK